MDYLQTEHMIFLPNSLTSSPLMNFAFQLYMIISFSSSRNVWSKADHYNCVDVFVIVSRIIFIHLFTFYLIMLIESLNLQGEQSCLLYADICNSHLYPEYKSVSKCNNISDSETVCLIWAKCQLYGLCHDRRLQSGDVINFRLQEFLP